MTSYISDKREKMGWLRVAAGVPAVTVADVDANIEAILHIISLAQEQHADILVLPELCITAYTCADLFHQHILIRAAENGLKKLLALSNNMLMAVGVPVAAQGALYNCAALICNGKLLGLVPKTFLPNYGEFYERRWFAPAPAKPISLTYAGQETTLSAHNLFRFKGATIGIEICEDLWAPNPPSTRAALAGADVILNLSASNEVIGKHEYLLSLIRQQSARLHAAYVYASAGHGESSTDLVFAGNGIIAENGTIMAETPRFTANPEMAIADIDIQLLQHEREYSSSWRDSLDNIPTYNIIDAGEVAPSSACDLMRRIDPAPFVPNDAHRRSERCAEIFAIQSHSLMQRMKAAHIPKIVVGISGGLDSTLALLVAVDAFKRMGRNPADIIGITMPGFGTTSRTHNNARKLIEALGVTFKEISIAQATLQHFKDIEHDANQHDLTYENAQARERTQILMDYAGSHGALVLGTGDLSELALGWCTYNADHMSMYGVNASIPKTLVKYLVQFCADTFYSDELRALLLDIIDTPISPELLPPTDDGNIAQRTEELVGPYELHDFFIYYALRFGFPPEKLYAMARIAFEGKYNDDVIKHWLKSFYRRFFTQQFKRSCLPDGPKVGSICLSPRGDWRMPSDASSALWLKQAEEI